MTVVGGALADAAPDMRGVFDFLLEGPRPVHRLDDMGLPELRKTAGSGASDGADPLGKVVSALERAGSEAIVVDITTDEARQVGMHVVKALVPRGRAAVVQPPRPLPRHPPPLRGTPRHGPDRS